MEVQKKGFWLKISILTGKKLLSIWQVTFMTLNQTTVLYAKCGLKAFDTRKALSVFKYIHAEWTRP